MLLEMISDEMHLVLKTHLEMFAGKAPGATSVPLFKLFYDTHSQTFTGQSRKNSAL